MEAISAREAATATPPKLAIIPPYTIDAGPPFNKANWKVTTKYSHEARITMLK